ncbi:MAG TPA: peptidoglycan DD-metalloendopeptidase family protein [Pseudomonadales bacterium]|nr:peptidoglycan DD-metalloendopeptidase family protein [Pseudomonadales bacterium]
MGARRPSIRGGVLLLLVTLLLSACAARGPAPVSERGLSDPPPSGEHRVRAGDTLYSIAWRYGVDWQELARRNRIPAPYTIQPGQRIRIVGAVAGASGTAAAVPSATAGRPRATTPAAPTPTATRPVVQAPTPVVPAAGGAVRWRWPLEGRVVSAFSTGGADLNKGIDIRGAAGAAVRVAAAGEVVYAGTGLRGHTQLVIVKHDDTWLSAYAHNSRILVKEGQRLDAGDALARLEGGEDHQRVLHFEIRRDGKPVNPTTLLPRR